jgi:Zn-dependent M28 family amino/carboxypeptidase
LISSKLAKLTTLAVVASAQAPTAPLVSIAALKADTAYLASDLLGGRLPGTPGGDAAVSYMIRRMKEAGLEPGYRGHWTQDVPLVTLTPDAETSLTITGAGAGVALSLRQSSDAILWTKTPVAQLTVPPSQMVFVGYGINAPERGWNDYAGVEMCGKIAVILVNDPDWQSTTDVGPFGGKRLTYYGRYTYKYEEAARQGAAGALIIHDTAAAGYPFQVLVNTNAGAKIDIDLPSVAKEHAALEGWLSTDAAQRVFKFSGKDLSELTRAAQRPGFQAVSLGLSASITIHNKISRSTSRNVVGMIRGSSRPTEAFIYSAHWDHLGPCGNSSHARSICNGAVDNATGSAGLLALAQAFHDSSRRPRRSVLFLSLTGEEQGLLGSAYYVKSPAIPIDLTAGGLNIDVMNVFGPTRDVMIMHPGMTTLEPIFIAAALRQGRSVSPEMMPNQGLFYRSDQLTFARAGVPFLFASSGMDRGLEPPPSQGLAAYFQIVYHTAQDVYDPNWNWEGAVQDLQLYYDVGRTIADGAAWPTWSPNAEFHRAGKIAPRAAQ